MVEAPPEKGVPLEAFRRRRDVYLIYTFEDVAFVWKHHNQRVFRRFKGDDRESETVNTNRLFTDAQLFGREASKAEYEAFAPLSLSSKVASALMKMGPRKRS